MKAVKAAIPRKLVPARLVWVYSLVVAQEQRGR